jgi:hypothetical protein
MCWWRNVSPARMIRRRRAGARLQQSSGHHILAIVVFVLLGVTCRGRFNAGLTLSIWPVRKFPRCQRNPGKRPILIVQTSATVIPCDAHTCGRSVRHGDRDRIGRAARRRRVLRRDATRDGKALRRAVAGLRGRTDCIPPDRGAVAVAIQRIADGDAAARHFTGRQRCPRGAECELFPVS